MWDEGVGVGEVMSVLAPSSPPLPQERFLLLSDGTRLDPKPNPIRLDHMQISDSPLRRFDEFKISHSKLFFSKT